MSSEMDTFLNDLSYQGLIYIPSSEKFVSPTLQTAVLKFGSDAVKKYLDSKRIKAMIDATRTNYRNIKRICDTTNEPTSCFMAETIVPKLEKILEEFEQSFYSNKPLRIYKINEDNKVGELLLEINRPKDYE